MNPNSKHLEKGDEFRAAFKARKNAIRMRFLRTKQGRALVLVWNWFCYVETGDLRKIERTRWRNLSLNNAGKCSNIG